MPAQRFASLLVTTILASNLSAQAIRSVDVAAPDCSSCRISLSLETTIRPLPDSSFGSTGTMVRNSRGELMVVHDELMTQILRFDARGGPLGTIGRAGSGPGEFQRATILGLGGDDGVRVWDPTLRRLSQFNRQNRYLGTHQFAGQVYDFIALPGGGYLLAAQIATEAQIGLPIHLTDSALNVTRSFGASDGGRVSPVEAFSAQRLMTFRPRDGRVWLSRRNSYALEEWDTLGVQRRRIVRLADWFVPYTQLEPFTSSKPPRPMMVALQAGRGDLLWVVVRIPDREWAKAVVPLNADYLREPAYTASSDEGLFDSMIEVYSTTTGSLLASLRTTQYVTGFVDQDRLLVVRESQSGSRYFEVMKIQLHR